MPFLPDRLAHHPLPAVFLIFLRLGLTSFGGPVAHLGYFREEFVVRRQWLSEQAYADLVALCQFLPGPASSQVGMALGLTRCGYAGALAAWLGFTLPSALILILLASGLSHCDGAMISGVWQGLKLIAVAVVAQAVWGMARTLCSDRSRIAIMAGAASGTLLLPFAFTQIGVIMVAGGLGLVLMKPAETPAVDHLPLPVSRRAGIFWLLLFLALLMGLPLLAHYSAEVGWQRFDAFYRSGALVFGGGHVVLPLLQAEVVPNGWVGKEAFLAGYGAAQAMPGPLFAFAAFLGTVMSTPPNGWAGGFLCLVAIFLPAFLLVAGALPFWEQLRRNQRMQAALAGINAAVVGLLLAAFYQPVWTSAILQPRDFVLALLAFVALQFWKWPVWLVVLTSGLAGGLWFAPV